MRRAAAESIPQVFADFDERHGLVVEPLTVFQVGHESEIERHAIGQPNAETLLVRFDTGCGVLTWLLESGTQIRFVEDFIIGEAQWLAANAFAWQELVAVSADGKDEVASMIIGAFESKRGSPDKEDLFSVD